MRRQRLLSIGAAAEYLGVSRATVERLVFRGELPMVKVGGSTRYRRLHQGQPATRSRGPSLGP